MPVCPICTKEFTPVRGSKTCPGACRQEYHRRNCAERHREYRRRHRQSLGAIPCSECPRLFVPRNEKQAACSARCSRARNLRLKNEAASVSRAVGWSLSVDPFAAGLVREWEGRRPDWAMGF